MSETILLLTPTDDMIPVADMDDVSGTADIAVVERDGAVRGYHVAWDDVTLDIQVLAGEDRAAALQEFQMQVAMLLEERRDKKARKIRRRAERMVQVMRCTVDPDWDAERKAQHLLQSIMAYYDYALIFAEDTVYNENGNIEVGHLDSDPKYWAQPAEDSPETPAAVERKQRSIAILKAERIPTIEHLPVIADEDQAQLRTKEAVIQRALALNLISRRAEGQSLQWYEQKVQQYRLQEAVTPDEWDFAVDEESPDYIVIKFSQRLESCWLLLWALSLHNHLKRPDNFCNPAHAHDIIDTRSPDQMVLDATLRPKTEILDAADLHYRYHWAVIDAELYGKKPPRGLQPAVVYERHYALNWLIGYRKQAWDDVTTDT